MVDKNDWRLTIQGEYLTNARVVLKKFEVVRPDWDHEHCCFCWDKFSEYDGDLHEGYCTLDGKHWICKECFNDFKEMFGMTVVGG